MSPSPERVIALTRVALLGLGLGIAALVGWGNSPWWAFPALCVGTFVTERASARIAVGRQGATFALNDAVMAVAFLLAPGGWVAVAAVLGYVLAKVGRRPWVKVSFNAAQQFFAVAAALLVAQALPDGIGAAAAGLGTYALLNSLVVAIPIAATSDVSYGRVLVAIGPLGIVHTAGNASVGLLAGWLAVHAPLGLLGLIVPVGLLWWSYEQQTRRASEAQLFEELAQGQERVAGGTVDASAQVVVTAAARLFG
ncbi:MAG TPA: hypothetical protein VNC79_04725, partial [Mycobacteriales bacterium]|nr:hypothetical protein [Mycobacteriales bacterium]